MQKLNPEKIVIPSMVKAELLFGAEKSSKREENLKKVFAFLSAFQIAGFDSESAEKYAEIRFVTEKNGMTVGPNDLVIAATAIRNNAILVTNNMREFENIQGLKCENWVKSGI
jgi:tRNA(fMet)-specific endonuclease VapC